jgi:hypothetical protein
METKSLPIMKLDPGRQKELFYQAVTTRFNDLLNKIEPSIDPDKKMEVDYNNLIEIFEKPSIEPELKSQLRTLRHQVWGSCKQDEWVQIKDIFLSRLGGMSYDFSLVDHEDIEALLSLPPEHRQPQLENQIWAEAYYQYFNYLKGKLYVSQKDDSIKKIKPEIELDLTEKMLIISYLQDYNLFPKNDAYQNRNSFDRFIAMLFDVSYDSVKNKYKILKSIKSGKLSKTQIKPRIKNLLNVLDAIVLLENEDLKLVIQNRLDQLQ